MLNIGILGCGNICDHYFISARDVFNNKLRVVAASDVVLERAQEKARQYGLAKAYLPEELFADPEVDLIVNLTVPMVHEELNIRALECGKHVYTEKPLALTREGAKRIIHTAEKRHLRVGSAPDTYMSAPVQTVKKLLEQKEIGDIVGVQGICPLRGNESWRPDSDFFYKKGAGPILDMAPYYFNIIICLFGSLTSVVGMGRKTWPIRTYTCAERKGDTIDVEVPTHVTGIFEMESGALFTFTNSFDITASKTPYLEIYGEKGTITMPFPNFYQGDVWLHKNGEWSKVPQLPGYENYMRGAAIADMAVSLENEYAHLAGTDMAFHVVDAMNSWEEAIESDRKIKICSRCPALPGMWERKEIR